MKKYLLSLAVLLAGTAMMTSCSNDDDPATQPQEVAYSNGAYVVNAGNMSSNINGSVTWIDYASDKATQNRFASVNGRNLGGTVNDGIVYGSKAYLVSTDENTVEVVDKNTFKSVKQLKTTDLLGAAEGNQPRHIVAANGCVYVSTYGGYVAAIDTLAYGLKKKYQVGSYPEGMACSGQKLVVANSDHGQGNGTLSTIDLATDQVTTATLSGIVNPSQVYFASTGDLYVLDLGSYDANWKQLGAGLKKVAGGKATDVVACTMACVLDGKKAYYINSPYTYPATPVTYGTLDLTTGTATAWEPSEKADSPSGISVDPVKGDVYILSYKMGDGGYADYSGNGYVLRYNAAGTYVGKYDTGVGPTAMFFDSGVTLKY